MQNFILKKFEYILFFLLSFIYILLLFGMIKIHYHELASIPDVNIYEAMKQYNWKYWFEESDHYQTVFSEFLQFMDMHYLKSRGIIPIVVNISFIFLLTGLISIIIHTVFHAKENYNPLIPLVLVFSSIVLLFSAIQDSSIVWMFNQQLFAAYFFPLLSYYLLVKLSISRNNRYFYALLLSGMMIVISTPYYFSALIVLLLLGYVFKIGWFKNVLIFMLILLSFFLYADEVLNSTIILNLFNGGIVTKIPLYVLSYLGSLFVYVSFEPCIATSSVLGGIFIIGTFIYFSYLSLSKKLTEPMYWVILAFLFFYILTAFASLAEIDDSNIIIFKNQYMTPSLIGWSLILILYIHHFSTTQVAQRRVLTFSLTLISVLYFYQIFTYRQYKEEISELKLAVASLKLGVHDKHSLKSITRFVYTMMYCPSKEFKKEMSIFTVNDIRADIVQNKVYLLKEKTPFNFIDEAIINRLISPSADHVLKGALDKTIAIDKEKNIIQIHGWVYNMKETKVPYWLIVLDQDRNIIGYVITGNARKDVEMEYGKDASGSGFSGYIKYSKVPSTLFMVDELEKEILKVKYLMEQM